MTTETNTELFPFFIRHSLSLSSSSSGDLSVYVWMEALDCHTASHHFSFFRLFYAFIRFGVSAATEACIKLEKQKSVAAVNMKIN